MKSLQKTLAAGAAAMAVAGLLIVGFSASAEAQDFQRGQRLGRGAVAPRAVQRPVPVRRGGRGVRTGVGIAAGVAGALALGAIAAQAAQPRPTYVEGDGCYRVRRRVWSEYDGAYVMRRVTVCD